MSLDDEIAEARAQFAALKELAEAGDPVAALVVERMGTVEAQVKQAWADNFLNGRA